MNDPTDEMVAAVIEAVQVLWESCDWSIPSEEKEARATIAAAAPFIERQVRDKIAAEIDRREFDMAFVQGESPRPASYSEGHYTGWRKGLSDAARIASGKSE